MSLVEEALFTHLSGFAGLTALISTRIYPMRLPQKPTFPAVTYLLFDSDPVSRHRGPTGKGRPYFQIDAWGSSYAGAKAVAEQIRLAMIAFTGTISGVVINGSRMLKSHDLIDPEPGIIHVALEFEVVHAEAVV